MEDFEEPTSDCCMDSSDLSPMPPLIKPRRIMLNQGSREYGPSSVPPSPNSSIAEGNTEKASCMRSASLENRENTRNVCPDFTSLPISASPPSWIKCTRNTVTSASISDCQTDFKKTFLISDKSERDEAKSSTRHEMEHVEDSSSTFSADEERGSHVKPLLLLEMDVVTPATASYTGVSAGRQLETWEQPGSYDMLGERGRPIGQHSVSSKVMAQS
eukprot:scpid95507/ scgid21742/ 